MLTRRSVPVVLAALLTASSFGLSPWLGTPSEAWAQDAPERTFAPLIPADTGQSGVLDLVNSGRRTVQVAVAVSDATGQQFLQEQFGPFAGVEIPPGGSVRIPYVAEFDPGDPIVPRGGHLTLVPSGGGVEAFLFVTDGAAIATARTRRALRATRDLVIPGFEHRTDGGASGLLGITNASTAFEAAVSVEVRDGAGVLLGGSDVTIFPMQSLLLTGEDMGVDGAGTIFISSDRALLATGTVGTASGVSFLSSGRDVVEFGQFWYPFVDLAPFESGVIFANVEGGGTFGALSSYFSRKGVVAGQVGPLDVTGGDVIPQLNAGGVAVDFRGVGALGIDVPSGSAPRAPVGTVALTGGDFAHFDAMRRIEPGEHGVAPVPADDTDLMANSALVVNNPTNLNALGLLRLLAPDGRVLLSKKLKVKAVNTVTLPFPKLLKKAAGASTVEILMPLNPGKKGGGPLQAAVVLSSESLDGKRPTGDSSRIAVTPLVASEVEAIPAIVGAQVTRPDEDKKAAIVMDGRAAAVGKKALLKMVDPVTGEDLGASYKIRGGKKVLKLKLKAKSVEQKNTLALEWPVGEERTFVLVDVKADTESAPVTIRRGAEPVGQ